MTEGRREIKSRSVKAFHWLAFRLVKAGLTPNQVSVMSMAFAAAGALCLLLAPDAGGFFSQLAFLIGALLGIQLRLVCNLVDGLMAVEGGMKTAYGELFNDFPDRVSDALLILAAGYSVSLQTGGSEAVVGWAATLLAVLTAYIRVLGASMGTPHFFLGPMAKQHRMAALNLGILGSAFELVRYGKFEYCLTVALYLIAIGALITCANRIAAILKFKGKT
jgi:phosphatidylglycerophosphate synthase